MEATDRKLLPAFVCAATLLAVMLIARPYAEIPLGDDFSYIYTAKVLAQTGHIAYTGWVSAIIGWQLYLGALFIKVFGFSFTVVRSSVALLALVTAFLCQRTLVRAGIRPWNAMIGTLVLVLSPMFVANAMSFLSDVAGLFSIVLCLYACFRALEATTPRSAIAWIGFAALSNAVFGSARQIAWLGAFVMVPSAIWILRRNRKIVIAGAAFYVLAVVVIAAILAWFQRQPYTQASPFILDKVTLHVFRWSFTQLVRAVLNLALLVLPLLVICVPSLFKRRQPWPVYTLALVFLVFAIVLGHQHELYKWYAPFLGASIAWPQTATAAVLFSLATALGVVGLLAFVLNRETPAGISVPPVAGPSDRSILTLLLPFTAAYLFLLIPRAAFYGLWDRYLMAIVLVCLILLLRFYEKHGWGHLPVAALVVALAIGAYSAAFMHDYFSYQRARLAILDEVYRRGVPPTAITGDWDVDGWTEMQYSDHVNTPLLRVPNGVVIPPSTHYGINDCDAFYCDMYPHMLPKYALSRVPDPAVRQFTPVPYKTWISYAGTLYVVRFH